ncbi:DMT family transporter [Amylibacter sp. IMCC11727]|uniref:DMT family transporter n=1 Tax=Amylibacter sp. IMCC11727 TaxID=3039851 RepID=UPI00244E17C3|nr:DMT family transporter [Amylibacter sp. IMCC11727]WGI22347.1 DMT family transporter [Amylibacter sp. IMCC11727]
MTQQNARAGIWLMVVATFVFATQDGISRHLAENYNVFMIVMIRYWFFLLFVVSVSKMRTGSVGATARTSQPWLQFFRGVLLACEILVTVIAFTFLGLIEAHAIFAVYPLIVAALSGPILGEAVGWRRWAAISVGFVGMLIILQPGFKVFSPYSLIAVGGAFLFALYNLLTRLAAAKDTAATSFFWTGVGGFVIMTAIGPFFWEPMSGTDWRWMALLCVTGATGHYLLIKAYEKAEASTVQPFAYLQLVFASMIGVSVFGESLPMSTIGGAGLIVVAGIFTLWREQVAKS